MVSSTVSSIFNSHVSQKWHTLLLLGFLGWVVWSRLYGISWGLPYPMHPDERNMAIAIEQMHCTRVFDGDCMNPHFFAYGQLTLYTGFFLAHIIRLIGLGVQTGVEGTPSFDQIVIALRLISATASIGVFIVLVRVFLLFEKSPSKKSWFIALAGFSSVPAFIQFAHFGTTESLLMAAFVLLFYEAAAYLSMKKRAAQFIVASGIIYGCALGIKTSALIFGAIPITALVYSYSRIYSKVHGLLLMLFSTITLLCYAIVFYILTSPYNSIAWTDFLGSMAYESSVGLGTYRAFYTRQFEDTIPFVFHMARIFPYALGGPLFLLSIAGFFRSSRVSKLYVFLWIQIVLFCIPTMAIYAKWTRFVAPVFALMVLNGVLFCAQFFRVRYRSYTQVLMTSLCIGIGLMVALPGVAYMAVYLSPDSRAQASEWIYQNLPSSSSVLSETANVVDIPFRTIRTPERLVSTSAYQVESFGFYDLDENAQLQYDLDAWMMRAHYIFVPSRRVFYNHTCIRPTDRGYAVRSSLLGYELDHCIKRYRMYPKLQDYYDTLFSGKAGFSEVARFTSYPRIVVFGKTLLEFPDEDAEETWTVFDHPVIRIWTRSYRL